jgi:single-stranded-DNA-specific exonuclease
MSIQKQWVIKPTADIEVIESLSQSINVSHHVANLLAQRGIATFEQARNFFRPDLDSLYDPFLMKDMAVAVERLAMAVRHNEKVLVYGDYDVDGTTSVSLMYSFLKSLIPDLYYYIPDRYSEGYGISHKGIDYAHERGCTLIIALDCGIKANDKVDYAAEKNIDFIIVDHHEQGAELPTAIAILDPKRADCQYPFKELSACGVAFKFVQAYSLRHAIPFHKIQHYLDLVVVSIASDIVPIIDENRILAYYGLKQLNEKPCKGLKAILTVSGLEPGNLKINDLVFKIGPRINAAGRVDLGRSAVDLLISGDDERLPEMADKIDADNTERKQYDSTITKEAIEMIASNQELIQRKSTVLYKPHWHKGVIGIVASRIIDHYYRPTVILTKSNGFITGSARSVPGFNLYKAIEKCQHLLENFGGHMYAAGLTLKEENLEPFILAFENAVADDLKPEHEVQQIEIDAIITFADIQQRFYSILSQFEPFGPGNMPPVFATKNAKDTGFAQTVGLEKEHLKMYLIDGTTHKSFSAIAFKQSQYLADIKEKARFHVCYSLDENTYMGKTTIQLKVRDIKPASENIV